MISKSLALAFLLCAAACGHSPDAATSMDNDVTAGTASVPAEPTSQPEQKAVTAENASAGPQMDRIHPVPGKPSDDIPLAFQGRFELNTADCGNRDDAKGLLIGPDGMRVDGSAAHLTTIATDDPQHFVGNFDFVGKGRTWKSSEDLKLTEASRILVRTDDGGSRHYTRCQ